MELTIKRGDIYYAELNPVIGSEQGGTGNEGGSVRTTVGVELPWCQFAADHLATSHSISGCRGQIEMLLSYQPNERRS